MSEHALLFLSLFLQQRRLVSFRGTAHLRFSFSPSGLAYSAWTLFLLSATQVATPQLNGAPPFYPISVPLLMSNQTPWHVSPFGISLSHQRSSLSTKKKVKKCLLVYFHPSLSVLSFLPFSFLPFLPSFLLSLLPLHPPLLLSFPSLILFSLLLSVLHSCFIAFVISRFTLHTSLLTTFIFCISYLFRRSLLTVIPISTIVVLFLFITSNLLTISFTQHDHTPLVFLHTVSNSHKPSLSSIIHGRQH